MFGRRVSNHYHTHNTHDTNVTITEKRAPTDESVRLLKEMEEAARNKVLETIVVADTSFECKIHKMVDPINDQDVYNVVFSLGKQKRRTEVRVDKYRKLTPQEVAVAIRDAVAVDISNHLLSTAFQKGIE